MKKSFGFTLAEVLITLGIIGVVAAMTMPTLINSTQGAQYKAAYKKALSALSQGVTLNVALDDYDFADTVTGDTEEDYTIAKILNSRMNVVKTTADEAGAATGTLGYDVNADTAGIIGTSNYTFYFNDGMVFSYPQAAEACSMDTTKAASLSDNCYGIIDVNGAKGPNRVVKCDGETDYSAEKDGCAVTNPTDIYPVVFYDSTVLPSTDAARAVLYGK